MTTKGTMIRVRWKSTELPKFRYGLDVHTHMWIIMVHQVENAFFRSDNSRNRLGTEAEHRAF